MLTETMEEHVRIAACPFSSPHSQLLQGIRPTHSHSAPPKVRLIKQPTFQTRVEADQRELQLERLKQRIVELEDLVKNGNVVLSEFRDQTDQTKTEMQRRITELEDVVQSDQTTLIEAQEHTAKVRKEAQDRVAEMEETLTDKCILLEHAAKVQAEAQQRVAEMEETLKNNRILLEEAANHAEVTKQVQCQIAELEESAMRDRHLLAEANKLVAVAGQGREPLNSAAPAIGSQLMPGGMPSTSTTMEMEVDQELACSK
jgi:chromosome segregation ATPase